MKYLNEILIDWNNILDSNDTIIQTSSVISEMDKLSTSKIPCIYYPTNFKELSDIIEQKINESINNGSKVTDLRAISLSNIEVGKQYILTSLFEDLNVKQYPEIINVSHWDTTGCTDFNYCFYDCKGLKRIIGLNTWNTSKVESMIGMFAFCSDLEDIGDLSKWNTSKLRSINEIFDNCVSLSKLDDNKKLVIDYETWKPKGGKPRISSDGNIIGYRLRTFNIVKNTNFNIFDFICFKNLPHNLDPDRLVTKC